MARYKPGRRHSLREEEGEHEVVDLRLPFSPGLENSLSVDEYARNHQLSVESTQSFTSTVLAAGVIGVDETQPSVYSRVEDSSQNLSPVNNPASLTSVANERFEITRAAHDLTDWSIRSSSEIEQIACLPRPRIQTSLSKLGVDLPILPTDHEYDCRELSRSIVSRRHIFLQPTDLPLEDLSEDNDESLSFPETTHRCRDDIDSLSRNEKFDMSRQIVEYVVQVSRGDAPDCLVPKTGRFHQTCAMALRVHLTPPLFPLGHTEGPFVPDPQQCQVPLASDPISLIDQDMQEAEAAILQQDEMVDGLDDSISSDSLSSDTFPLVSCRVRRFQLGLDRMEEPVIPLSSSPVGVTPETLPSMLGALETDHPAEVTKARGSMDPEGAFSDDLLEALQKQSEHLKKVVEQERFRAFDSEARVPIPVLDFTMPEPEWEWMGFNDSHQWGLSRNVRTAMEFPPWPGSLREKDLCWIPADLKPIAVHEVLDDGNPEISSLESTDPTGPPTSADFVWKYPGVAVLQDSTDDDLEQIEPLEERVVDDDLESLVRKRRAELTNPDRSSRSSLEDRPRSLLIRDDASAGETLLSNYMEFRAAKRQKCSTSSFFPGKTRPPQETDTMAVAGPSTTFAGPTTTKSQTKPRAPSPETHLNQAPVALCPPLVVPKVSEKIIRSIALGRSIFSKFAKLYPDVDVVERDFARWNSVAWERGLVSRSPVVSPLAGEADMIVSPTTGIVITTLLRAIQKPPPGHKGASEIRERLSRVALRYERLIILVSEGNKINEAARDLTSTELVAYTDFAGFVAGLNTNGQTYYIGGGDETLARWLLHFVVHCAPEPNFVQNLLVQEETHWELFLRRAGMNAYAAQVILSMLKDADGLPNENVSRFGLPQFIRMSVAERLEMFGALLGGENVLRRVSNMIDASWD